MLKKNEWTFWADHMPANGVFAISISDDVLDKDCWPVWCIVMCGGVVEHQHDMYTSDVHDRPNMEGWTKQQVLEFCQYEPGDSHPQISHDIIWMAA